MELIHNVAYAYGGLSVFTRSLASVPVKETTFTMR